MYAKMILVGRSGFDPEYRTSSGGKQYARLSIAVSQGKDNPPEWYYVFIWDPLAEILKPHITKGTLLFIEGRPKMGSYLDTQGDKKVSFSITAQNVYVLSGWKSKEDHEAQSDREGYAAKKLDSEQDKDFPF